MRRARLPEGFGRRFMLFVDVEEEFNWRAPLRRDGHSTTTVAALPEAHRRFRSFGLTPAYMTDYPVVDDPVSAAILRRMVDHEDALVGAQLHPWVNPPHDEELTEQNSFVGNLPVELERAKLVALTQKIEDVCGTRPVIYRAGRYGIGPNSARLLIEQGYRLDVSTRALFEYRREKGPDYSRHPLWPWWADPEHRLLALPMTSSYIGRLRRFGPIAQRFPSIFQLLGGMRLLERAALTPEGMPIAPTLMAIDAPLDEGVETFSMSLHSPSLVPGHTPYVFDEDDLAWFWRWWDAVLNHFARAGVTALDPRDLIAAADAA